MKSELNIAVVGMSGRFPGAGSIAEYWQNLVDSVDSLTVFDEGANKRVLDSLDSVSSKLNAALYKDPNYVHAGYVLDDIDKFDAGFFGYNPSEAELIDPQHRIFLEIVWEAFEDAGYDPYTYTGRTGVYAGTGISKYFAHNIFTNRKIWYSERDLTTLIGNEVDYLATRVAYKLNLRGPTMAVGSACSSSLVAIHLACESIRNDECDMAIAGGSIVSIPHGNGYLYREGGMYSRDGHCRVFDERASGTVFANGGAGCVLLKPLEAAMRDGDHIYAVVKGTAVSNDGNDKSVMTAPSVSGQVAAAKRAISRAGVSARSISYVEAHGTGTAVGDPTEVSSLSESFRLHTDDKQFCALGSVKTNIGHLDRAAGVAGFIKTAMALKNRQIPASLHYEKPNPRIDFDNSPFFVNTRLRDWETDQLPRRAGINSFGVGGTNAHAVIEEAPEPVASDSPKSRHLLALSARSDDAVSNQMTNLANYLEHNRDCNLDDVAFTLHCGRHAFSHRRSVVVSDIDDAISCLKMEDPKRIISGKPLKENRNIVFMFSGQGSQHINMGKQLYDEETVYRNVIDNCARLLESELGFDIRALFYPDTGNEESAAQSLMQTSVTQPALFITEYALAQLLLEWGIKYTAMVGHSIGEYVAACLSGVFSLGDAIKLVATRGRLMQGVATGSMLSVALAEQDIEPYLNDDLSLAAVNGPTACVVSGPEPAIKALAGVLDQADIPCRELQTSHAFHSHMMDPILSEFIDIVKQVKLSAPQTPYLSNVTGSWISEELATDPGYWAQHLRGTVRFADCINTVTDNDDVVLLEVGPGNTLGTLSRQCIGNNPGVSVITTMHHPKDPQPALGHLLGSLGRLWCAGINPDWKSFYAGQKRNRLSLPTYPFERQRFWVDAPKYEQKSRSAVDRAEGFDGWFSIPSWNRTLSPTKSAVMETDGQSVYLLFTDNGDMGIGLTEQLKSEDRKVMIVGVGSDYDNDGQNVVINPDNQQDYNALIQSLAVDGKLPELHVLHLWGLMPIEAIGSVDVTKTCLDRGFYSLLYLAQAIGQVDMETSVIIDVVSTRIHDVSGNDPLEPQKATVLGPCKVIPLEYTNIKCRNIDIDNPASPRVLKTLINEISYVSDETVVAYRNGLRWVQTFEPAKFPPVTEAIERFKSGTVCLITGGLGGLGLETARYLAKNYSAKLVLIGRSPLPQREQWSSFIDSHQDSDRDVERIRKIIELEDLGSEVEVIAADTTDYEAMTKAVAQARQRFGRIDGVIHAAGVAGGGMIQLKSREAADKVLLPKIQGALILDDLLRHDDLEYFILTSSLFSVVGGIGQVDYCAANSFLDVFGQSRHLKDGHACISINWDAWQEIGMAVNEMNRGQHKKASSSAIKIQHPLLESCIEKTDKQVVFETDYAVEDLWILGEHVILGNSMIPGTGYLEITRAAFDVIAEGSPIQITDSMFMMPLEVYAESPERIRVVVSKENDEYRVTIRSQTSGHESADHQWQDHFSAKVAVLDEPECPSVPLQPIIERCGEMEISLEGQSPMPTDDWEKNGFIQFGPRWRNVKTVHVGEGEVLLHLRLPEQFESDLTLYKLHPSLLDMATGVTMISLLCPDIAGDGTLYLPWSYDRISIYKQLDSEIYSHSRFRRQENTDQQTLTLDIRLFNKDGDILVDIDGFTVRKVPENLLTAQPSERRRKSSPSRSNRASSEPKILGGEGIPPAAGMEAFERIMGHGAMSQVVVSTIELEELMENIAQISRSAVEDISDSRSSGSLHPRPDIPTPYVAPETDLQKELADLWKTVLGIEKVGIHDNVFELGADSVIGVQVVSKARDKGIMLSPNQLFEHQTIAELAAIAAPISSNDDHHMKSGPWLLSPNQTRYLAAADDATKLRLRSYLYELKPDIDATLLGQAIERVGKMHPASHMRLRNNNGEWQLLLSDTDEPLNISHIKLAHTGRDAVVEALPKNLASFDEPLLRISLFDVNSTPTAGYLAISVHDVLFDHVSVPILLNELQTSYQHAMEGHSVSDDDNTDNLIPWMNFVKQEIKLDELVEKSDSWIKNISLLDALSLESGVPEEGAGAERCTLSTSLALAQSKALCQVQTHEAYNTNILDFLLASLVSTISSHESFDAVLVDVQTSNRDLAFSNLDLYRSVGQFDVRFPALIGAAENEDGLDVLKTVKEQLRSIPVGGMGFDILKNISQDEALLERLNSVPKANLSFEYSRNDDTEVANGPLFNGTQSLDTALVIDGIDLTEDRYNVSVKACFESGQLNVIWTFAKGVVEETVVQSLANNFISALTYMIEHCESDRSGSFTPSDFPESGVSQNELDALESLFAED